jgi:hypothetical protein
MRGFCFLAPAAPKKLAALSSGGCASPNPFGSNSFWLHPPPLKQNLHFSKAGLATLWVLHFISNINVFYPKKKCTVASYCFKKEAQKNILNKLCVIKKMHYLCSSVVVAA